MNDLIIFGCLFIVVSLCLITFFFYNTYRGVHDSLDSATVGTVYNFRYFQPLTGDYERYLAKVVSVRKLSQYEIARLNWHSNYRVADKEFQRSPTLITCLMGNGDFRQFYAERSDMCKRTVVGSLLFKAGVAHMF
jgi:hypothetical protein